MLLIVAGVMAVQRQNPLCFTEITRNIGGFAFGRHSLYCDMIMNVTFGMCRETTHISAGCLYHFHPAVLVKTWRLVLLSSPCCLLPIYISRCLTPAWPRSETCPCLPEVHRPALLRDPVFTSRPAGPPPVLERRRPDSPFSVGEGGGKGEEEGYHDCCLGDV